ncbi:MAG: transcriptional repressor [Oscillospiraceae bacterium]|nr:transcriptional repressor [Oscillospiraceae bacterium]
MMQVRRHSYKRDAILRALMESKLHPTAEQIYTQLKPEIAGLSLATVYRNLSILKQDGVINSVGVVNGEERFDADTSRHAHLICSACGSVTDVETEIRLEDSVGEAEKTGIEIAGYSITFYGKCKACCGGSI